jgi:phenylpyruvate tautomerase PptA (4-oxalocrotonate tautomerase family)
VPTYTCITAAGSLDSKKKSAVARVVTLAHSEITGAPTHFAQVIFQEVMPGNHFVGGTLLEHDHLFIDGRIRDGRSAFNRKALIRRLTADVAIAAGFDPFAVWVYLQELPAAAMVEYGHVLPEAGEEPAWTEALPSDDRRRMQVIEQKLTAGGSL